MTVRHCYDVMQWRRYESAGSDDCVQNKQVVRTYNQHEGCYIHLRIIVSWDNFLLSKSDGIDNN